MDADAAQAELSAVVERLRAGDEASKLVAFGALAGVEKPPASVTATIVSCLADPSDAVRVAAASFLCGRGTAADLRYAIIDGQRPEVRSLGLASLCGRGPDALPLLEPLSRCLASPEPADRERAALALSHVGAGAVPRLKHFLRSQEPPEVISAAEALRRIGPNAKDVVGDLEQVAPKAPAAARPAIYTALITTSGESSKGLPELLKLLEDRDPEIRSAALTALGTLGDVAKDAGPAIFKAANDRDARVRASAVVPLLSTGLDRKPVLEALRALLRDPQTPVRSRAASGIACLGAHGADALDDLRALGKGNDTGLAAVATGAVAQIEGATKAPAEPPPKTSTTEREARESPRPGAAKAPADPNRLASDDTIRAWRERPKTKPAAPAPSVPEPPGDPHRLASDDTIRRWRELPKTKPTATAPSAPEPERDPRRLASDDTIRRWRERPKAKPVAPAPTEPVAERDPGRLASDDTIRAWRGRSKVKPQTSEQPPEPAGGEFDMTMRIRRKPPTDPPDKPPKK
jgi:HEAT repeat protein